MAGALRIAVLVSGEGTTAEALAARWDVPGAPAEIVLAVADRPCPAIARLALRGIPGRVIARRGTDPGTWAEDVAHALAGARADLVVLAGFLSVVPDPVLERFHDRVINVHPSLLPRFGGRGMYGERVHAAVLADGSPETGVTVHLVTPSVDAGPILWQKAIPVGTATTPEALRERVRPLEVDGLAEVVASYARLGHAPPAISPR